MPDRRAAMAIATCRVEGSREVSPPVLRARDSSRLGIGIDRTGDPRNGMPLGIDLESVKPSKRRTIHPEASCAERVLDAAEGSVLKVEMTS